MIRALAIPICSFVLTFSDAHAASFSFEMSDGQVNILYEGAPVATYVYEDDRIPRPFFCNVIAPNGEQVTRRHPTDPIMNKDNDDHGTYHPGIWLAFGDLGGEDFWRNDASVSHVRFVEAPSADENSATFIVENAYESLTDPSILVCTERCTYTFYAEPSGYYFLMESTFSSEDDFTFGDQEEMGIGARLATRFTVEHGTGAIRNSEGGIDERGTWGRAADWCSYYGEKDSERIGVTIMPSPENFRRSWFHTRDYGLMVANPFGEKAMTGPADENVSPSALSVNAGEAFRLGFGIRIFSEPANTDVDSVSSYTKYLQLRRFTRNNSE